MAIRRKSLMKLVGGGFLFAGILLWYGHRGLPYWADVALLAVPEAIMLVGALELAGGMPIGKLPNTWEHLPRWRRVLLVAVAVSAMLVTVVTAIFIWFLDLI